MISPARLVAYDVLRDVDERDAYANLALAARIREAKLQRRDAAFATELAASTLRERGRYDRIIELAAGREIAAIDSRTRNVLRLGTHQLLGMRTAAHAAVNESVELQRVVANRAAAGFVNGVLRTISRSSSAEWDERIIAAAKNSDDAQASLTSHPAWVLRALRASLRAEGREHELEALLVAHNEAPRVSLALMPGSEIDTDTAEALGGALGVTATGPSPIGLELAGGDPAELMRELDLVDGALRVQDQGSQLIALALSRVRPVDEGERWLDLCAGPGGKSAVLAAEAALFGVRLRANEVSPHRADLVRESVAANEDVVDVVSYDGRTDDAFDGQLYDRILVDAPCTGLGALRRRPEARWRKSPADLPELTGLQRELIDAAIAHLAPGGVLAYATCSPHISETRVVMNDALKRNGDVREIDAKAVVQSIARTELDLAGDRLSVQLWPHRHGTDAMFLSLIQKVD